MCLLWLLIIHIQLDKAGMMYLSVKEILLRFGNRKREVHEYRPPGDGSSTSLWRTG